MSVRHLDTIIAISPQFDRIAWRIGRFASDFSFPTPADKFYHEHFVRMLDNGNLLMLDNGNGRPPFEGGRYTRALELALDWQSMTARKVWEYRHPSGNDAASAHKYADKVGTAQRLDNGNTIVLEPILIQSRLRPEIRKPSRSSRRIPSRRPTRWRFSISRCRPRTRYIARCP